jgi:hypothetical protein
MISKTTQKIKERVNTIKRFRLNGHTSPELRKALFLSFVLPLFTWHFPIFPLFTRKQQEDLSHLYFTCLKRISFHLEWSDSFYAFALNEISLEDRVFRYWENYQKALSNSTDGYLLIERANWNVYRNGWIDKEYSIKCLRKSKRFKENSSVLVKSTSWCANNATTNSIPIFSEEEILSLSLFPETFL